MLLSFPTAAQFFVYRYLLLHGLPVSFNIADVLFKLAPRAHDLMAAAEAPELEIRAYALYPFAPNAMLQ